MKKNYIKKILKLFEQASDIQLERLYYFIKSYLD